MYQSFSNQSNLISNTINNSSVINSNHNNNNVGGNIKVEQSVVDMQFNGNTKSNLQITGGPVPIYGKRPLSLPINQMNSSELPVLSNAEDLQEHYPSEIGNQGLMTNMPMPKRVMMWSPNGGGRGGGYSTPNMRMVGRNRAQEMIVRRNLQMSLLNKASQDQMHTNSHSMQNAMLNASPLTFNHLSQGNIPLAYANLMAQQRDARSMNLSSFDWNALPPGVRGNQRVANAAMVSAMKAEKSHIAENPSLPNTFIFPPTANDSQLQRHAIYTPADLARNKVREQKYDVNVNVTVNVNGGQVGRPSNVPSMYQNQAPRSTLSLKNQYQNKLSIQDNLTQIPTTIQNTLQNGMSMNSRSGTNSSGSSLVGECVNCHKLVVSTEMKVVCSDCEKEEVRIIKDYLKTNIFNDNNVEDTDNPTDGLFEMANNRQKDASCDVSISAASVNSSVLTPSLPLEKSVSSPATVTNAKSPLGHPPLSPGKLQVDLPRVSTSPTTKSLPSLPGTPELLSKNLQESPLQFSPDAASSLVSDLFEISKLDEKQDIKVENIDHDAEGDTKIRLTGNVDSRDVLLNEVITNASKEPGDLRLIGDLSPPSPTNIMCSWNADETLVTEDIINLVTNAQENTKDLSGSRNKRSEEILQLSPVKSQGIKFCADTYSRFNEDDF